MIVDITELFGEVESDLKVDDTQLDFEATKNPLIAAKYLKHLSHSNMAYARLLSRYNKLKLDKRQYYLGQASPEVYKKKPFHLKLTKSEVDQYLDADEELRLIQEKLEILKVNVSYLEGIVKAINTRSWDIRNAIEYRKFMVGV